MPFERIDITVARSNESNWNPIAVCRGPLLGVQGEGRAIDSIGSRKSGRQVGPSKMAPTGTEKRGKTLLFPVFYFVYLYIYIYRNLGRVFSRRERTARRTRHGTIREFDLRATRRSYVLLARATPQLKYYRWLGRFSGFFCFMAEWDVRISMAPNFCT